MSIHKNRNGRYRVRWRDRGKMRSKTFLRKLDADQFEAKMTISRQTDYDQRPRLVDDKINFKSYAELWLRDHGAVNKTESSLIRDRQLIRDYLNPRFSELRLVEITKHDIVSLQSELVALGRLRRKSINNTVGLLKKMLADAVSWSFLLTSPAATIKPIKIEEQDFRFWTFEERDRFLSYAKAHDDELYALIVMAIYTGLRRGEVEGLLRDCLDFDRREIIVRRNFCHKTNRLNEYTKGKNIRRVPMNNLVFQILRERSLIPMNGQVFPHDYEHMVIRRFYPAQKRAGVSKVTFHDLRHTFASHLAMSGVGVFQIKELLGHSDLKTTMRYMHLAPGHLAGITDVLLKTQMRSQDAFSKVGNDLR